MTSGPGETVTDWKASPGSNGTYSSTLDAGVQYQGTIAASRRVTMLMLTPGELLALAMTPGLCRADNSNVNVDAHVREGRGM